MPQPSPGHAATSVPGHLLRSTPNLQSCFSLSDVPEFAVSIASLAKSFPPARTGWRAFLQPFEKPTIPALHQLSLDLRPGESVALLGANGAGKTTLLRILSTLLLPTSGRASVAGHDTAQSPAEVRRNLGYHAGSDLGFYPRLTGRQNLIFFGQLNHLSGSIARDRVAQFAAQFELAEALDRQVRTLSSGTIQRLSLARALMHLPRVLLLDEPTRSLDAIAAASFRHFLRSQVMRPGKTSLLFASHSLAEIELLANRVAVLQHGRLIALDTPAALKRQSSASTLEEAFFRLTGHAHDSLAPEAHS